MKRVIIPTALLLTMMATSHGQTSPDLPGLEGAVAKQFEDLRIKGGLKPLKIRRDMRLRMEACSIQVKGPASNIEGSRNVFWYLSVDPKRPNDELARLAQQKLTYDHVAVGVWFARTEVYPSGMYWVVVATEQSPVNPPLLGDNSQYLSTGYGDTVEYRLKLEHRIFFVFDRANYDHAVKLVNDEAFSKDPDGASRYRAALPTIPTGILYLKPIRFEVVNEGKSVNWMEYSTTVIVPASFEPAAGLSPKQRPCPPMHWGP